MKYHLYDEHERHQGTFESIEKLRNFLCDRKYDISCDADLSCTFDYFWKSEDIMKDDDTPFYDPE